MTTRLRLTARTAPAPVRRVTLVLVGLWLVAGCGTVHPTVSELQAVPGATSAYPGSVAVGGHGARAGEHTLVNSTGAELFTTYCAAASQPEVLGWFDEHLRRDGWAAVPNPVGTTSTDVVSTVQWQRGERLFTLELYSRDRAWRLSSELGKPCPEGYRTFVQ